LFRCALNVLFLSILIGCISPTPTLEPHLQVTVPENWTALPKPSRNTTYNTIDKVTKSLTVNTEKSWLADFEDQTLLTLVEEALGQNFDLKSALARVEAAQARAKQEGAKRLPDITTEASASRRRYGSSTSRSGGSSTSLSSYKSSGTTSNDFDISANISWEIDLWGRLRNTTKAAEAEAEAEQADYQAARLALSANVARGWFDAIDSDQQLRLAEKTVTSFENTLNIVRQQYKLGIGSALDVHLTRENLANAHSQREARAHNRDVTVRSLETLLGRYPAGTLHIEQNLPKLRRTIPVGLPSDLLNRRPDIIAANARLQAMKHRFAVARTNRLPNVTLTARGGVASEELRNLLDWDSLAWSLIGNLSQPLWRGGQLSADVELAEANRRQAWTDYTTVALHAFREVESTLTAEALLVNQEAAIRVAVEEITAATQLALEQYHQGLSDIVTLLSTQRRKYNAKSSLLTITKQRLHSRIDLHLALGGGF